MVPIVCVFIICLTLLIGLNTYIHYIEDNRVHKDNGVISKQLEDRIKAMDDLKAKMEMLLLKNGFGR